MKNRTSLFLIISLVATFLFVSIIPNYAQLSNNSFESLLNVEYSKSANNNVAFTIKPNKKRISKRRPHYVYGSVIVQKSGQMSSVVTIKSNHFFWGFTGGMKISFYDNRNNVICEVITRGWGVNGRGERTETWKAKIPTWVVESTKKATAKPVRRSSSTTEVLIAKALKSLTD